MEKNWLKSIPLAHRGLHSNDSTVPENSLAAFRLAMNENYAIELDIHLLADKELAVFHDDNLERMCGEQVPVRSLTSANLKKYRLLNSPEPIPLLREVFDLVQGRVPILIEIKKQKHTNQVQRLLIAAIKAYKGAVAIQSFDPFSLHLLAVQAPHILRGQLSGGFTNSSRNFIYRKLLQHYLLNFISRPHFIAHNKKDLRYNKTVQRLKQKDLIVLCWTIRSEKSYRQVMEHCDNIIFEGFRPKYN